MQFSSERCLPPEIVPQIFLSVCIPCHRRPPDCSRLGCEGATTALLLGKICTAWRDVAWDLPDLWQEMHIIVTQKDYEDGYGTKVALAKEWIQRAKGRPLTISIQPAGESYFHHSPIPIFSLLASHSTQWKDLYMHTPDDCIQVLNNVARGRIPCLESLLVSRDSDTGPRDGPGTLDLIADAPALKILSYDGYDVPNDRRPWPKLTTLTTGYLNNLLRLPHLCPNLEYLKFGRTDVHFIPGTKIRLQHLQSLVIGNAFGLLKVFEAPSLKNLSVLNPTNDEFSYQTLSDFVDRNGCNLQAFGIALNFTFNVEALHSLLSRMNNLTHLSIASNKASDYQPLMRKIPRMLDPAISRDDHRGVLLPKLEVLHYHTVHPVISADMVNMIKHRWNCADVGLTGTDVAKLRKVRFAKWKDAVLVERLKEEIEQGLDVAYDMSYWDIPF